MKWIRRLFHPVIVQRSYTVTGTKTTLTQQQFDEALLKASKDEAWAMLKNKFTRTLIRHLVALPDGKTKPGDVGMELGYVRGLAKAIEIMSNSEVPPKTLEEIEQEAEDNG